MHTHRIGPNDLYSSERMPYGEKHHHLFFYISKFSFRGL